MSADDTTPQAATTDDWASRENDASLAAAIELRAEAAGDLRIDLTPTPEERAAQIKFADEMRMRRAEGRRIARRNGDL